VTQTTADPALTVRLAAHLESLATTLHRAPLPASERPSGMDGDVALAHGDAVRAAVTALGALADGLLADADALCLVAAAHRRTEEQTAAALGLLRTPSHAPRPW
jgi:hypothetical protein